MTLLAPHRLSSRAQPSNLAMVKQAVIFDGDDTLWLTECLYDDARAAARSVVEAAGFDGARWETLERRFDVQNVAIMGHARERFPMSCVQAVDAIASGGDVATVRDAVREAAEQVFLREAPLRNYAEKVLEELKNRGLALVLLTKGEEAVQRRRVEQSGLSEFFDLIQVVADKSAEAITDVINRIDVDPSLVVSVGNSVRSDILPSVMARVDAVWIPAYVWEYERAYDDQLPAGVPVISELDELLDLLRP